MSKQVLKSEVFAYLIFGLLTTLLYLLIRFFVYQMTGQATLSAAIANVTAILFAFITNDQFVFPQKPQGVLKRFWQFVLARLSTLVMDLALAYFLVEKYPQIIACFVGNDLSRVNKVESVLAQILIIAVNYFVSKYLIFRNHN
ncbi:GtrA family protein [Streptococcus iniae]|uniref:GtrA family protein n=1 Tax=Streptococcus iniae TaxID=1346 RepID=A0A3L8GPG4_STRIN|nr:GtrA family protein [Streptococcus iniae]AGM98090.1 GtrA family protein [Streptococcus iniae SF1]AHY15158.1 sugar translocase [Streptococcus iniae]AHY17029.1 sugar translocase [Streptococcus iniae]AJG25347.1 sugar translocase [Streptococcus iniae]APD31219.1 sugar translocase [Streptococcus iniae]